MITLVIRQHQLIDKLKHLTGSFSYGLIVSHINTIQHNERVSSLKLRTINSRDLSKWSQIQSSNCLSVNEDIVSQRTKTTWNGIRV